MKIKRYVQMILLLCMSSVVCLHGMFEDDTEQYDNDTWPSLILLEKLRLPQKITSMCFNRSKMTLACSYYHKEYKNIITFIDMKRLKKNKRIKTKNSVVHSCFNDTSDTIGMITNNGNICLVDWVNNGPFRRLQHDNWGNADNSFVSLVFAHNDCFAVTKKGELFCCSNQEKQCKPVLTLPHRYDSFPFSILSMNSSEENNIALVGHDQKGRGSVDVVTLNKETIGYASGCTQAPIVTSCFSNDNALIALATGQQVIVFNFKDSTEFVKTFNYYSNVNDICFDATDTAFFVGLDDGSIYFSELYATDDHGDQKYEIPTEDSTSLYCLSAPIKILSYVKEENILCAVTGYEATLFNFEFS